MKSTVAVTGGSGFIALEIIKQLLSKGYNVRATVRSKERSSDLLTIFPNSEGQLSLYEADLLKEGSFDECFSGVDFVLHTASPFQLDIVDAQKELIDPAYLGTINVLKSVEKNLSRIKKVVVTSSVAAVVPISDNSPKKQIWTEDDWNTASSVDYQPYRYSKYVAEKAAWDWWKGKESDVQLFTICPSFVLGPPQTKRVDSTSIKTVLSILQGKDVKAGSLPFINISDVAFAHVACLENPAANGRYIISNQKAIRYLDIALTLKKAFPNYPIQETEQGEASQFPDVSNEKAIQDLGVKFTPFDETVISMAQQLIDFGLVSQEKK